VLKLAAGAGRYYLMSLRAVQSRVRDSQDALLPGCTFGGLPRTNNNVIEGMFERIALHIERTARTVREPDQT